MKVHPPCKSLGKKGFNRTELYLWLLTRSRAAMEGRVYLRRDAGPDFGGKPQWALGRHSPK